METLNEVVSSNISRVGLTGNGLIVEYKSGSKYLYEGVDNELYGKLLGAESKGKFINTYIKGKFSYKKL